jgi:hypothetical protein
VLDEWAVGVDVSGGIPGSEGQPVSNKGRCQLVEVINVFLLP